MLDKIKRSFQAFPISLIILIVVGIIAGVYLRFYNLDGKLYSNDETFSTTYIFGHDLAKAGIIDRQIVSATQLQFYQKVNPDENLDRSLARLLADPYVFPPLYAIGMQFWSRFWGHFLDNAAVITRSFSAFISLFSLPLIYWLCWELSSSTIMAWTGTALLAVSPFHLQYSQIVRTYSFLTVAILLSSASLLRAKRLPTKMSWLLYAITVGIGLYANVLFGFVIIAHAAYIIFREKFKLNKIVKSYLLSASIGISAFLPWFILFINRPGLTSYTVEQVTHKTSLLFLITANIRNIRKIFIDLNDPWIDFTEKFQGLQRLLFPFVIILFVISLYYIIRHFSRPACLFILCLIGFGGVILILKDAIIGGTVSTRLRYTIPYVLGIELAVAYFLTNKLKSTFSWSKRLGEIFLSILIVGGLLSCSNIARANSWWAFGAPDYPSIAQRLNQEIRPVVIYEDWGDALTMSYMLKPNVYSHLTRKADFFLLESKGKAYKQFSDIILFKPSKNLQEKIKKKPNLKLESLFNSDRNQPRKSDIWKVKEES